MNRRELADALAEGFDGTDPQRRVVSRAAGDLADSGRYRSDVGTALTPGTVVEELEDAPDDHDLVERWNWWIGSLALAYGDGYEQFLVRQYAEE